MTLHVQNFFERVTVAKRRIRQVSADEAMALARAGAVVLDVRDEDEFGRGHVEGAIHLDTELLEQNVRRMVPDEATPIVCYCSSGYRAALVADELQKLGYRSVVSIDGGLRAHLSAVGKKAVA
jgi:phage shock protein E